MRRLLARLAVIALASAVAGCGSTIVTKSARLPRPRPEPRLSFAVGPEARVVSPSGADLARTIATWAGNNPDRLETAADIVLRQALNPPVAGSEDADGFALMAAWLAWRSLENSGLPAAHWPAGRRDALDLYNRAVETLILNSREAVASGESRVVNTPAGPVAMEITFPRRYGAGYFDRLIPADRITVRGFRHRARVGELGVALVGERDRTPAREVEMDLQPPDRGVYVALGSVLRFEPTRAVLEIIDSTRTSAAVIEGSSLPLSADFTAPYAIAFSGINDLWLGIRGLLNVGAWESSAGVYLTEPFDPERIPVLFIHGLSSSPLVWRNVVSSTMLDPKVREHCQFWYAYYPTGAPVVQSAAWIRDAIAQIRSKHDPGGRSVPSRNLAIVGYSMGGTIARILSTDIGDRLWDQISRRPFDSVKLSADDRAELRSWLFWKPVPGVRQVIFIATPHRGTAMADASFAHLGSRLVRLPGDLLNFQMRVFSAIGDVFDGDLPKMQAVNGINSLSSQSPLYAALETAPFAPGVRVHSIIGDRGRGDSPHSSDGIVPYSSSHLAIAESELIVPTGHDAQAHPATEAEIRRILHDEVESMGPHFLPERRIILPSAGKRATPGNSLVIPGKRATLPPET